MGVIHSFSLLWHTLVYLKVRQIFYRVKYRFLKPRITHGTAFGRLLLLTDDIERYHSFDGRIFTFLNLASQFSDWNDTTNGMLWAYNLNYMDWLNQAGMDYETGAGWIDKFLDEMGENRVGLDPYPTALRGINWIKFVSAHREHLETDRLKRWNDSLYAQYVLLVKKLEYHLLGNHLLEDAYSLFMAALYFRDRSFYRKAVKLLRTELDEQLLADGAHYEQSPMYHCILFDRLLDCYNASLHNSVFEGQDDVTALLRTKAVAMAGHLASVVYADGSIPLLNDSAEGIAPTAGQLFDYARRLGLSWTEIPLGACGYRKLVNGNFEAIVDVGNVTAAYQPGHTHADTFNYELRLKGEPFVVDTGISTYNKTGRRQYERSTAAHNTVTVGDRDSSEVWGGFRVGRRARVTLQVDEPQRVKALHTGYGKACRHTRTFELTDNGFRIIDELPGTTEGISRLHLAPGVTVEAVSPSRICTNRSIIEVEGATDIKVENGRLSTCYNRFQPSQTVLIRFAGRMCYTIICTK